MSIEEIIGYLEESSRREHVMLGDPVLFFGKLGAEKGVQNTKKRIETIEAAIALLRTHPEAQPNEPLTLEELRGMEGWPVWTETKGIPNSGRWELVIDAECEDRLEMVEREDGFYEIDTDSYGKTWLAYRRPPKKNADE